MSHLLPEAPDVPVIIAPLWGGGVVSESALAVYADAISSAHPATKNLYCELAQASLVAGRKEFYEMLVRRMRQIGLDRIHYGSDGPQFGGETPRVVWKHFRSNMPLTGNELGSSQATWRVRGKAGLRVADTLFRGPLPAE